MNAHPDNHSTFGLGCHLEIITKHRLAHGISCASCLTWEQPAPHRPAAPVPRHIHYRQERQSKCLHAVSCLFLLPFRIIPLSQASSTVIPLLAFPEEFPSCQNREMLHVGAHTAHRDQGSFQSSWPRPKPKWNGEVWFSRSFFVFLNMLS